MSGKERNLFSIDPAECDGRAWFAKRGINLTKIESRPTKQKPWEYNFYLDFEGHRVEQRCKEVLEILEKKMTFLKILGSYPRATQKTV